MSSLEAPSTYLSKKHKGIVPAEFLDNSNSHPKTKDYSEPRYDLWTMSAVALVPPRLSCQEHTRNVSERPNMVAFLLTKGTGSFFGGGCNSMLVRRPSQVDKLGCSVAIFVQRRQRRRWSQRRRIDV